MSHNQKTIHIQVVLTLNERNDYSWADPKVQKSVDFSVPAEFYNATVLAKVLDKAVAELEKEFSQAKAEFEANKVEEV